MNIFLRRLRCLFDTARTSLLSIYDFQLNLYRYLPRSVSFGPGPAVIIRKLYKDNEEDVELSISTNAVVSEEKIIEEFLTIATRKHK